MVSGKDTKPIHIIALKVYHHAFALVKEFRKKQYKILGSCIVRQTLNPKYCGEGSRADVSWLRKSERTKTIGSGFGRVLPSDRQLNAMRIQRA